MNISTRNVTRAYRAATDADREAGQVWYARARVLAADLARRERDHGPRVRAGWADVTLVERAAGVIAALSPKVSWPRNVRLAEAMYRLYVDRDANGAAKALALPGVLGVNAFKAVRILWDGEDPREVLGGPKVRAFWWTIVNPDDPRAVVVDRHAVDVATNRVMTDLERGRLLRPAGAYERVAEVYRRAAVILSAEYGRSITPAQVQATTWTYWRRERAVAYHGEAAAA